ncbi:hypothetical protein [uncultured Clostridium sp.]|nr:hypothetical protein [uncultured Clostridium sp.]
MLTVFHDRMMTFIYTEDEKVVSMFHRNYFFNEKRVKWIISI